MPIFLDFCLGSVVPTGHRFARDLDQQTGYELIFQVCAWEDCMALGRQLVRDLISCLLGGLAQQKLHGEGVEWLKTVDNVKTKRKEVRTNSST